MWPLMPRTRKTEAGRGEAYLSSGSSSTQFHPGGLGIRRFFRTARCAPS